MISGEVTQLAFTGDGNKLIVVNQFRDFGNHPREKCHSRLRAFSVLDWKAAVDTSELPLTALAFAPCAGAHWLIQANGFDRFGQGNPYTGPEFYLLDSATLERKSVDVIKKGRDNIAYMPSADSVSHSPSAVL